MVGGWGSYAAAALCSARVEVRRTASWFDAGDRRGDVILTLHQEEKRCDGRRGRRGCVCACVCVQACDSN